MPRTEWIATYRLQLHQQFPLSAAAAVVPYLAELGISHVYLSPCLQAAPGSEHGYDVVDPTRISADLGGEEGWTNFQKVVRAHGLGVLLDVVPNHMSATIANPWWTDVLRHGPYSAFARFFDIDPCADDEPWRLRLCTLPEAYGHVLENGGFALKLEGEEPWLTCGEQRWPLNPLTWHHLVPPALRPESSFEASRGCSSEPGEEDRRDYHAAVESTRSWWRELGATALHQAQLLAFATEVALDPARLHALVALQYYRPCSWRLEGEATNYRRFFNISSLIGLRVEDPIVFAASHARIEQMIDDDEIDGLRIDHPDGLRDPTNYLRAWRERWPEGRIYVEKILGADEALPEAWPVDGTVGYDFLSHANRLWMDAGAADELTGIYADFTGHTVNFPALVRQKKQAVIEAAFQAERERLVLLALTLSRRHWRTQDLSRAQVREAVQVLTAVLPVYRTYLPDEAGPDRARDLATIDAALAQVGSLAREVDPAVLAFLRDCLAAEQPDADTAEFIARWQQLTPAVMAKGNEDTTFYLFDRLVSGNEVGSQPSALGISAEEFHAYCHRVQVGWPRNLLATSTHDNKRSEDVRLRISLLSEIPGRWSGAVQDWSRLNQPAWQGRSPDRHAEYLLYQTLVGAWPIDVDRAQAYMRKACREAKVHTSWHEPKPEYEEAIAGFVARILASQEFIAALENVVAPLVEPAHRHSLAQTLLKLTAPGTPDFYQGTELWDLSLVDPDNRRPVDFDRRRELLQRSRRAGAEEIAVGDPASGEPKLWLIARVLEFRRQHPDWFAAGVSYEPLIARGDRLAHVLGYRRGEDVIVLVPRFVVTLDADWGDTRIALPEGTWTDLFSGASFRDEARIAELFAVFPVALLFRGSRGEVST